jgi:Tfp pilus assembly protein PilN
MKAVNLIPADDARGGGGRSGAATYGLLGVMALLVVMSALYTFAGNSVDAKKRDLAAVTAQANAAEAKAATLKTYVEFSEQRKARVETVKNLVASRFDWSRALGEVARTVPSGTWITSLQATVSPAVNVGPGGGDSLRAALAVPAIEVSGCAPGQDGVARTLTSLRAIAGVQRVTLSTSEKADKTSGNTDSAGPESCGSRSQFGLTIFYEATSSSSTTSSTTAATPAAATGGSTP